MYSKTLEKCPKNYFLLASQSTCTVVICAKNFLAAILIPMKYDSALNRKVRNETRLCKGLTFHEKHFLGRFLLLEGKKNVTSPFFSWEVKQIIRKGLERNGNYERGEVNDHDMGRVWFEFFYFFLGGGGGGHSEEKGNGVKIILMLIVSRITYLW